MDHSTPHSADGPLPFSPVPVQSRHDGWTAERQYAFVQALLVYGAVKQAAASVGMSRESAYRLRRRPGAESFAASWDEALRAGRQRALEIGMEIGLYGVEEPVFYRGEKVGTRRRYNNVLLRSSMLALDRLAGKQENSRRGKSS